MGFDYECIVDVSQLAGEYFCPVCSQLVYPDEALKTQCSHLFCKPCLTYTVSTSQACPYDGFLVTEADSKPLKESDKALAETIGKIPVTCLYNRSGCPWKGNLSECSSHCGSCAFGSSPVVCNRCGVQIVHRQVQEHVQNCPGIHSQVQQAATVVSTSAVQSQTTNAPAATTQVAGGPPSQDVNQQAIATSQVQAVTSTIPQNQGQYYQQHQQYYQQHPGYDLYQQQYQHYYAYQQPTVQQFQQHPPVGQGQHPPVVQGQHPPVVQGQHPPVGQAQHPPVGQGQHPPVGQGQHPPVGQGQHPPVGQGQHPPVGQGQHPPVGQGQHPPVGQGQHPPVGQGQQPVQVYPHPQQQAQVQAQPQPQIQLPTQSQPQIQTHHPQPQQLLHAQAPVTGQNQNQAAVNPPQQQYLAAGQPPFQMQAPVQAQSHGPYPGQQQRPQQPMPQYHQQSHSQVQHPPTQIQPPFQQQQPIPQQPQIQPPFQAGPQYVHPPPPFHAVSGHQSYGQPQAHQHMQVAPQQVNPQNAFPQHPPNQYYGQLQHPPQMKSNVQLPSQLPPTVLPAQGPAPSFPPAQQLPMYGHAQQLGYPSNHRPVLQPSHQSMPPHSIQSQQTFQGQPAVPVQNQLYPSAPFVQQQMRPPHSLPTAPHQSVAPQNMTQQSQNYNARPTVPSHGVQPQPQPAAQSPAVFASAGQDRPMQPFMNQAPLNQNDTPRRHNQLLKSSEQQIAHSVDIISNSGPSVETTVISNQGTYGLSSDGRRQINKDIDTESNPKAKGTGTLLPENGSSLPDPSIKSVVAKKVDAVIETSGDGGAVDTSLEVKTKNTVISEVSRSEFEDGSKAVAQDQGQGHVAEDVKIFPAQNEKQGKAFPNPTNQIPVTEQGRDPSYPLNLSNSGQHQRHPGSSMFPLVQSQNITRPQGPEQMHLKGMQLVPPERFPAGLPEGSFELTAIGMGKGSYISQPHPNHPGEAGHFHNLKSSSLDGRKPDSHSFATSNMGPYGEPSMSELISARGKREQGSDPPFNIEDGLNRFPVDPARQHDRVSRPPYKLDAPRDVHDRVRPLGPDGNTGRLDPAFLAPTSEFPRHHMDRLDPRSPGREYLDYHSRNPHLHRNQTRLDDINGWESHPFNDTARGLNFSSDPIRHPFSQDRLPQRGEVDIPGNFRGGDLTRPEILPPHMRKGDPFSSGNFHGHFPLPEPGFGSYGDPRMGDFAGPGNLHHRPRIGESLGENIFGQPRIGEPGFRSSYSSATSLDSIERRRPPGIYCRICDVVCESLEALEMHAHTKDHQKMSLNIVANIKRNAKKRKATNLSSLGARSHRDI